MEQIEQVIIPLSKRKLLLFFSISIIVVWLGVQFVIDPAAFAVPFRYSPRIVFITGLVGVPFFGLVAIVTLRKLLDKKAGLIVNKEGIIDNASGVSAGLILWSDIREIKIWGSDEKCLMIIVKNPQDYIDNATNPFKRGMMKSNHKSYGSPISISASALQTNFDDLHQLLLEKMKEYK